VNNSSSHQIRHVCVYVHNDTNDSVDLEDVQANASKAEYCNLDGVGPDGFEVVFVDHMDHQWSRKGLHLPERRR
jgi:hypothetical protein